jgi:DNA-directed RNA polymerase specialized sigma24 family protein
MRQILVDHARERAAAKRGGGLRQVTLDTQVGLAAVDELQLLELDRILSRLTEMDERMGRVVEYRVFAGMSVEEVAHVLGFSVRTVYNDWRVAKMWLSQQLAERSPRDPAASRSPGEVDRRTPGPFRPLEGLLLQAADLPRKNDRPS